MTAIALDLDTLERLRNAAGAWYLVAGQQEVAQAIAVRFRTWKGEWWLDTAYGTPYTEDILIKAPDLALIRARISRILSTTPGVIAIVELTTAFDRSARSLSWVATVQTAEGALTIDAVAQYALGATFVLAFTTTGAVWPA